MSASLLGGLLTGLLFTLSLFSDTITSTTPYGFISRQFSTAPILLLGWSVLPLNLILVQESLDYCSAVPFVLYWYHFAFLGWRKVHWQTDPFLASISWQQRKNQQSQARARLNWIRVFVFYPTVFLLIVFGPALLFRFRFGFGSKKKSGRVDLGRLRGEGSATFVLIKREDSTENIVWGYH